MKSSNPGLIKALQEFQENRLNYSQKERKEEIKRIKRWYAKEDRIAKYLERSVKSHEDRRESS